MSGQVHVINAEDSMCSNFVRDETPYMYHEDSVEDIQFSPTEPEVFGTCSVDGTVQIVDMRAGLKKQSQLKIHAHECDVNVISWNSRSANLLATGGDEGAFKVWDLRFPKDLPITNILWHTEPITSIQWQTGDEWGIAVSSSDNRMSIWDLSVEPDDQNKDEDVNVPDQLMFVHQGQDELKEIRWHPYYKDIVLTTANNGFNIFKPALDEEESEAGDDNELDFFPDPINHNE